MAIGTGLARAGQNLSQTLFQLAESQRAARDKSRQQALAYIVQVLPQAKNMGPDAQAFIMTQLRALLSGKEVDPEELENFRTQTFKDAKVRSAREYVMDKLIPQFIAAQNDPTTRLMILQQIRSIVKETPEAGFDLPYNITQGVKPLHPADIKSAEALVGPEREHADLMKDFVNVRRQLGEMHPDWDDHKLSEQAGVIIAYKYPWINKPPMDTTADIALKRAQTWRAYQPPGTGAPAKALINMQGELAENEGMIKYSEAVLSAANSLAKETKNLDKQAEIRARLAPWIMQELAPYIKESGEFDDIKWDAIGKKLEQDIITLRGESKGIKARIRNYRASYGLEDEEGDEAEEFNIFTVKPSRTPAPVVPTIPAPVVPPPQTRVPIPVVPAPKVRLPAIRPAPNIYERPKPIFGAPEPRKPKIKKPKPFKPFKYPKIGPPKIYKQLRDLPPR